MLFYRYGIILFNLVMYIVQCTALFYGCYFPGILDLSFSKFCFSIRARSFANFCKSQLAVGKPVKQGFRSKSAIFSSKFFGCMFNFKCILLLTRLSASPGRHGWSLELELIMFVNKSWLVLTWTIMNAIDDIDNRENVVRQVRFMFGGVCSFVSLKIELSWAQNDLQWNCALYIYSFRCLGGISV